jgi:poly(hydroxyalkanoate) depolymerase family esterase
MNFESSDAMREITKLTRAQKLMEATRLIQSTLRGRGLPLEEVNPEQPQTHDKPARFKRPLGEAITILRRAKQGLEIPTLKRRKTIVVPEGAQFLSGSFVCPAGKRDYRLYIPSNCGQGQRPLIVMLHGCKQDPVDFAIGTQMNAVAEEQGLLVLYPAQPAQANAMACWNWFNPKDQMRDSGEPSILAGMTRQIISEHNIDQQRVYAAGLSAGGAMAVVLGVTYPDVYRSIGVHSGLPYQVANDVISAFAAMRGEPKGNRSTPASLRIPTIVFHGNADPTVHPSNAENIISSQAQVGDTSETETAANRAYTRTVNRNRQGKVWSEQWRIHQGKHGWSGGSPEGSFTEQCGPDASREMVRFFLEVGPHAG